MESARQLADALFLRNPYWVKHWRKVWGRELPHQPLTVIAEEPEFMRLEEQTELFAQRIKRLGRFQFFLRPAYAEGDLGSEVSLLSIWKETGVYQFPEAPLIHRLRTALAKQSGIPLKRLLAEQEKRIPPSLPATAYPLSPPQPRQTWPQPRRPSRQRKSGSQTSSDFQPRQRTQPQPPPDGAQAASDAAQAIVPLPVGRQGLPTRRRHNLS